MLCSKIYSLFLLILLNLVLTSFSYRLPDNSYPLKYDLRIKVYLEQNQTLYEVREKVYIKIKYASHKITMNSKFMKDIKNITMSEINSNIAQTTTWKFVTQKDLLIVDLPNKLLPDSEIILNINFNSNVKRASSDFNNNRGIVMTSYTEPNGITENLIFTGFDPNYAREFIPCYDEPSFKAKFELEVEHHEDFNSVSNMPVKSRKKVKGNKSFVRTKFQETPKMSTYLLAFFVTKLPYINVTESRVPQRIYTRNLMVNNEFIKLMTESLGKILQFFEDLFQMPYSLPKIDHVIVPDYYKAIENWGVIGYSERSFKDKLIPYVNTNVLFHEIAHHYFGNLVTPKWWSYMWLKEGLSSFYENEAQLQYYPNLKDKLNFFTYYKQLTAMVNDSESSINPLSLYVESPKDVLDKLNVFTYYKGSSLLNMFRFAFGNKTWNKGIQYYLKQNQYEAIEPKDLHEALQKAYNEDNPRNRLNIGSLMSKWENYNGHPNISVSLVNGTLKLVQMNSHNPKLIYSIPITYSSPSNLNFENLSIKFWMTTRTIEIRSFSDKWIVFNNQQLGYYKVDYDETLWNGIIDQFNTNHTVIHWINRITLMTTLIDNVDSGISNPTMLYRLMKYIKHENNLEVIEMSVNPLYMLILKTHKNDKKFKSELRSFFTIVYEKVKHDDWFILIQDFSCYINVRNCTIDLINKMVVELNYSQVNGNSSDLFCDALRHANETIVDLFYDRKKESIYIDDNSSFIENIGCIESPKLLEKSMRIFFEDNNHQKFQKIEPPYIPLNKIIRWMRTDSTKNGFLNFVENNLNKLAIESPVLLGDFLFYGRIIMESESLKKRLQNIRANALKINDEIDDDSNES